MEDHHHSREDGDHHHSQEDGAIAGGSCPSNLTNKDNNKEISIAEASSMFPGFRFSPTDEELICFYLQKKIEGLDESVEVIPEVDICRFEPRDLPAKSIIQSDREWFFFSPRGKKYPNGSQSKRATDHGYWKATGKERTVKSGSSIIGTKRTLVFHTGRAPKGQRTEWIMHEYTMSGNLQDHMVVCRLRKNMDFRLEDTPRKKSQESRPNNDATGSSGIEQTGASDGVMVADCCSKECSNSYNSRSVEQIDSGFESDDKVPNELSPHASSSNQKEQDSNEDDYFADIMKDDIIKLDDSAMYTSPQPLRMVSPGPDVNKRSKQPDGLPYQGTANRRLRLVKQKLEDYEVKKDSHSPELSSHADSQQPSILLVRSFSTNGLKRLSVCMPICIPLIIVAALFLFVQVW